MAKKIHVLGTGCQKCRVLAANAEAAVRESGIDADIEKVEKVQDILKFGVMMTPTLVVDGHVKTVGKVPGVEEIRKMLE